MERKQSFGAALVPPSGENHPTQFSFKGPGKMLSHFSHNVDHSVLLECFSPTHLPFCWENSLQAVRSAFPSHRISQSQTL